MSDSEVISKISRLRTLSILLQGIAILGILLISISPFVVIFSLNRNPVLFVGGLVCIVVSIIACLIVKKVLKKVQKGLKACYGEYVIKDVLAERMEVTEYDPVSFISRDTIKKSSIMPGYDRITGSDYTKAVYKGVSMVYCDLHLEVEHKDSDGDGTHWVTTFKGPFVRLEMKKPIDGYVRIKERKRSSKKSVFAKVVGTAFMAMGVDVEPNQLELESEEFNQKYQVSTDNDELAFYILTPHFMERLMELDEMADGYTNLLFKNGQVQLAVNNGRDAFELKKSITTEGQLNKRREEIREELNIILAMIDEVLEKDRLFQ